MEDSGESQSESENSVSDSVDENDDSVAEISRSFRSRQELCEQLNVNHMIQRIFLITLDNSKYKKISWYIKMCVGWLNYTFSFFNHVNTILMKMHANGITYSSVKTFSDSESNFPQSQF